MNGCISDPDDPLEEVFVQGTSMCETDTSCADDVQVGLCSINGLEEIAGIPLFGHVPYFNEDGLNLAQIAWDFFSQFELPAATAVPTAPTWGLGIAALLLIGSGLWTIRQLHRL